MLNLFTTRTHINCSRRASPRKLAMRAITRTILAVGVFALTLFGGVRADLAQIQFIPGHAYVGYDVQHVPCSGGSLEDVTSSVDEDGHVYDLYGNNLTIQPDHSIRDANSQAVGFVCTTSPNP